MLADGMIKALLIKTFQKYQVLLGLVIWGEFKKLLKAENSWLIIYIESNNWYIKTNNELIEK